MSQKAASGGKWRPDEDEKLRRVVEEHGPKNWKIISKMAFNGSRSDVQCLHRWQKVLKPGLVKGPWLQSEDEVIISLINKHGLGNIKWSEIASSLPGRLGKQCRERWMNHLDPELKKTPWTDEEDRILMEKQKVLGNKWREIAAFIPGRSENSVKNRWNSARRKRRRGDDEPGATSSKTRERKSSKGTKRKNTRKEQQQYQQATDNMMEMPSLGFDMNQMGGVPNGFQPPPPHGMAFMPIPGFAHGKNPGPVMGGYFMNGSNSPPGFDYNPFFDTTAKSSNMFSGMGGKNAFGGLSPVLMQGMPMEPTGFQGLGGYMTQFGTQPNGSNQGGAMSNLQAFMSGNDCSGNDVFQLVSPPPPPPGPQMDASAALSKLEKLTHTSPKLGGAGESKLAENLSTIIPMNIGINGERVSKNATKLLEASTDSDFKMEENNDTAEDAGAETEEKEKMDAENIMDEEEDDDGTAWSPEGDDFVVVGHSLSAKQKLMLRDNSETDLPSSEDDKTFFKSKSAPSSSSSGGNNDTIDERLSRNDKSGSGMEVLGITNTGSGDQDHFEYLSFDDLVCDIME